MVSLCFAVFSLGAKAAETQWTATWNLSNHQSVDWRIEPGASVFRGWTLNINGSMAKGQVYHKDVDWVRVYVNYNMYNATNQTWLVDNAPSSYTEKIHTSDIPANLDADHAQDILTALNNINSSVHAADEAARQRLEAINNSINNNYQDLTRPSDSDVDSASGTLSDTSDVTAKTVLFTSIDNITQGVFNLFANPGSTELIFPGFGMEVSGVSYDVWADTSYNLSDIDDKFSGPMSVVRFATSLLVYLALIRYLINTYHRIFGEGE